jgi:hypothetical protein
LKDIIKDVKDRDNKPDDTRLSAVSYKELIDVFQMITKDHKLIGKVIAKNGVVQKEAVSSKQLVKPNPDVIK